MVLQTFLKSFEHHISQAIFWGRNFDVHGIGHNNWKNIFSAILYQNLHFLSMATFEDFQKIDIRVGKILEVEEFPELY